MVGVKEIAPAPSFEGTTSNINQVMQPQIKHDVQLHLKLFTFNILPPRSYNVHRWNVLLVLIAPHHSLSPIITVPQIPFIYDVNDLNRPLQFLYSPAQTRHKPSV